MSPVTLNQKPAPAEIARLLDAIRDRLNYFTGLPEWVTAFRPEMAALGKPGMPNRRKITGRPGTVLAPGKGLAQVAGGDGTPKTPRPEIIFEKKSPTGSIYAIDTI